MTMNDNTKKKIDEIISVSLDRIELIPETKEIKYYVPADELFPGLLRISPKKVEEAKRQFEVRGLKVEIVNKKHFHVTYSQENIIFSPEQAQRNLDILTKRMGNNNK